MANYELKMPAKRAISESSSSESSTPATRRAKKIKDHRSAEKRATKVTNVSTSIAPPAIFADMAAALPAENPFDNSHFATTPKPEGSTAAPNMPSEPGAVPATGTSAATGTVPVGKVSGIRKERHGTKKRKNLDANVETRASFKKIYKRLKRMEHANEIMNHDMIADEIELVRKEIGKINEDRRVNDMVEQTQAREDITELKEDIAKLKNDRRVDEMRAAYRHKMLFNSLKKISEDVNDIKKAQQQLENSKEISTPQKTKQAPKTKEQFSRILESFTGEMDRSKSIQDVGNKGDLCIKYAEDFFRNF
ncbi:hypothetical protein B0T25DRAFT_571269 [Lasiosphaeria hispida]|uniref:Uncharacterized protein n=1 Tax=Lasiosphaeria hispida TaxID=260671 RepID=A0AAJ0HB76_9PEZI|nr:hypothetical protein B0T25DRAFT_571269 [Lasiosphaeria hispida]